VLPGCLWKSIFLVDFLIHIPHFVLGSFIWLWLYAICFLSLRCTQRLCLYMVWKLRISKAVRQHFILFRSLDIAFVIYRSYLSMPTYHHLSSLYMYILKIRRVGLRMELARHSFFFSILLPHSMSCYVYLSTAQSLEWVLETDSMQICDYETENLGLRFANFFCQYLSAWPVKIVQSTSRLIVVYLGQCFLGGLYNFKGAKVIAVIIALYEPLILRSQGLHVNRIHWRILVLCLLQCRATGTSVCWRLTWARSNSLSVPLISSPAQIHWRHARSYLFMPSSRGALIFWILLNPSTWRSKMSLGPHLYYDGEDYKCLLCDRWFGTAKALYDHCRYTNRHEWCETCMRVFVSTTAKNQHLFFSPVHSHICTLCSSRPRFDTAWELKAHRIDYHNLCDICGKYFDNENNLRMASWCSISLSPDVANYSWPAASAAPPG
jgi:hypothetical protein